MSEHARTDRGPRDSHAANYGKALYPESITQAAGAALIFQDGWDACRRHLQAEALEGQLREAREVAFDLFNQACQVKYDREKEQAIYDHMCLSAYEIAQECLIEWGLISEDQCQRK